MTLHTHVTMDFTLDHRPSCRDDENVRETSLFQRPAYSCTISLRMDAWVQPIDPHSMRATEEYFGQVGLLQAVVRFRRVLTLVQVPATGCLVCQ